MRFRRGGMGTLTWNELHAFVIFSAQKHAIKKQYTYGILLVLSKSLNYTDLVNSRFHSFLTTLLCLCVDSLIKLHDESPAY